ncbi:MAG: acetolactate decarboxylase [Alphaproteobacteria bacterium]|nr:acetolactate decarboxylase [Alphaproteobacteria bacterium]
MKNKYFLSFFILILGLSCKKENVYVPDYRPSVVQIGVVKYLDTGAFAGLQPIGIALNYGGFGLGTLTNLDGELTIYRGKIFKLDSSGRVYDISLTRDSTPYTTITSFDPKIEYIYNTPITLADLERSLDSLLPDTSNLIFSIRITANFDSITTRTYYKINPPFPTLAVARQKQVVFNYQNKVGTAVGFWYPSVLKDINHAGYHFHFISDDLQAAGHILNANMSNVVVTIGTHNTYSVLDY